MYNIWTQFRFDHDTQRIEAFYLEEPNSIDVVLLGGSDLYTGYSPGYAYGKYKYTSYCYSIALNPIELYITQLKEIYSTQTPKMVLIELSLALGDKEADDGLNTTTHRYIDAIPDSNNRDSLIDGFSSIEDRLSCYFPFIMYHGVDKMWQTNMDRNNFVQSHRNDLKGIRIGVADFVWDDNYKTVLGDNTKVRPTQEILDRINSLINYCEKEKIPAVFTRFPHRITQGKYLRYQYGNYVKEMIQNRGYDFIDFEATVELDYDYTADFTDGEHLNGVGQRKLTERLGEIVSERYNINKSVLSAEGKENWEKSSEYTDAFYEYYDDVRKTPNEELKRTYGEKSFWENKELTDILDKLYYKKTR